MKPSHVFTTLLALQALLIAQPASSAAQNKRPAPPTPLDRGAYVARLGNDTLAVETYTRSGNRLKGRSVLRGTGVTIRDYTIDYAADGSITRYDVRTYPLRSFQSNTVTYTDSNGRTYRPSNAYGIIDSAADSTIGTRQITEYRGDSAYVTLKQGTNQRSLTVAAPGHALPFSENMFAPWNETIRGAGKAGEVAFLTGRAMLRYNVERPSADHIVLNGVGNDFGPMQIMVDAQGRMTQLDMRATTDKYLVDRVDSLDLDALMAHFVAHPLGAISPRDTVRAQVANASGNANITIDYSRPSVRGRTIFGGTQKWGEVWRAGADAATQLTTDRDIRIANVDVPAGTYTIFMLPAQNGDWQLIINKQHGQWGTIYDEKQDLARIPVKAERPAALFETLTFTADGNTLVMQWETTRIAVPITVK